LERVDQWNHVRTSAIQFRSLPMWFLGFSNHEKGAPRQILKWPNGLQHVFKKRVDCCEKWVECCKKFITCKGRYFEKETITTPPQNSDSE
jgi:hypothetical protein